jgi:hypothetical protein
MIKTEEFNRPSHPDFMDSSELKKAGFSGTRVNSISHDYEIWLKGEIIAKVTEEQLRLNPLAINQAMEEAFDIEKVMPDTPEAHRYMDILDRHEAYNETIKQLGGIPSETDYSINGSGRPIEGEGTEPSGDDEDLSEQRTDWGEFLAEVSEDEEPLIDEAFDTDYDELDPENDLEFNDEPEDADDADSERSH